MATIFSKIVNGELPSYKIAENHEFLAFLDISPLVEGHTLVIPKKESDYIFDIDDDEYSRLWKFAKEVSHKIKKTIDCKRIGVAVIGLEVAHAHIHLVPINDVADINFAKPKLTLTHDELNSLAQNISSH